MNERILELAIEARKYAESKPDIYQVAYDKKFAELIVAECLEVAGKDWHTPDGWGYTFGQKKAIEFIKEHFGVGE